MNYVDFLEETYQGLRQALPSVPCGAAWDAWLEAVGAVLVDLEPGAQLLWMQRYATVVLIRYGDVLPCRAEAYVVLGLVRAAEARVRELSCEVPALMAEAEVLRYQLAQARALLQPGDGR